ncbi:cupin domain-containing protein [Saccharopolyspora sp. 6V]|uniref:cupin domain-containing protein n=1 Tax=Saccharopolyspora sp. 6V TaxID=2877239 RepID=UPI001CD4738E|nr:cupin domain-containing protein [Saccharopolyspora sp. 6V]MCA1190719.1 cupin domain-containing protein [Saccharopolyspora sp. 6V]
MSAPSRADAREDGARHTPPDSSPYTGLARRMAGKQMLPFVLHPTATSAQCTFREHDGDEFVLVLRGRVELRFPDRTEVLGTGDSAYFLGGQPHHFRSVDEGPAELLAVIAGTPG